MTPEIPSPVLTLSHVTRSYSQAGQPPLEVLRGVNLSLHAGEMVALVGPSGSGKSTLLHAAGLLDTPTSGRIIVGGQAAENLDDDKRTALRRQFIGFVYQAHHLLPEFTALENVLLPQIMAPPPRYAATVPEVAAAWGVTGDQRRSARVRAGALLESVGLSARAHHRPGQLSGGEQQRVAIARALANRPRLLIADEPTGNLDPHTAEGVFDLLRHLTQGEGLAALVATHNLDLAHRMDRIVTLHNGLLE